MTLTSEYPFHPLSDYADIACGPAFPSSQFTDNSNDIPLVKGENLHQGYINWQQAKRWPVDESHQFEKYRLEHNDIVVAMDRPWVTAGLKWSYIRKTDPPSLLVQRVARLRAKKELNQLFLRCLISSSYFSAYIQPIVTGVNVPHISAKQIGSFQIPLPKRNTQIKIAAILTAYDDLIENNRQRIALLENIAEEIYREWFVRLRFPGHENTSAQKGIPEGWENQKLNDIIPENGLETGKRPKGGAEESGIPSIGAENVVRVGVYNFAKDKYVNENFYDSMKQGKVEDKDVLFYKDGAEIGRVTLFQDGFPHQKCCVNEHVFIIRTTKLLYQYFLYFYLNQSRIKEHVKMINKNAAQPGINKSELRSIPVLLPPASLIEKFNSLVAPIMNQLFLLAKEEISLRKTRDLLLNRLISGKLRVDDLDIQFPPSMQEAS